MRAGMLSAKRSTNELKGKDWEELCCHCRDMSKATGAKKPSESQKSGSPLGNEGSLGQE